MKRNPLKTPAAADSSYVSGMYEEKQGYPTTGTNYLKIALVWVTCYPTVDAGA
jgi:hypothetical protein